MIKFLANIFRGLSFIFGVTAPPPGEDERPFVFMWVGIFVFVVAVVALLFYALEPASLLNAWLLQRTCQLEHPIARFPIQRYS